MSLTVLARGCLVATLAATACGGGDDEADGADAGYNCALDDRGETYAAGMNKAGEAGYVFTLVDALPSPPAKSDNALTVAVTDAEGNPATAASLNVLPCMPDHGHGSPLVPTITPAGDGSFTIERLNLWMPGLWEISIWATEPDATVERTCTRPALVEPLDEVTFRFCIDG